MALKIDMKIRKNDNDDFLNALDKFCRNYTNEHDCCIEYNDQVMPDVEFFWWDQEAEKVIDKDEDKTYPFFQNFEPSFYFKTDKDRNMGWDHDFIEEIDREIKRHKQREEMRSIIDKHKNGRQ